jgi:PIN domain nuclease of toxin-antitoxin system
MNATNKIVLDASALLAVLNREAGADRLTPEMLSTATSSTVNLAEVQSKLVSLGLAPGDAWEATLTPIREATAFTAEHAEAAGNLMIKTRALGLSLGDRACLALGIALRAPVYTADNSWKKLKLGVPIHLIR